MYKSGEKRKKGGFDGQRRWDKEESCRRGGMERVMGGVKGASPGRLGQTTSTRLIV
jgi:hypothetical protein